MSTQRYIKAFTEDRSKTWTKELRVVDDVLDLGWPVQYKLEYPFLINLRDNPIRLLCIDMGGRNHGVRESVYVDADELVDYLGIYYE